MSDKIKVELVHVKDGEIVPVTYVWPCFNCSGVVRVSQRTFAMLESKKLLGVRCDHCLNPPPKAGVMAVVA